VLLELVDVLLELGDVDEVGRHLADVMPFAQQAQSKALLARVTGARAALVGSRGDSAEATSLYHEAARLAAEGGDAPSRDRYRTAARGESPTQTA
jgi:hypothetical protein